MEEQFRVKITHNEKGQTIRIPKELELSGDEVILRKMGPYIILQPAKRRTLAEALASLEPIGERLPEIDDPPLEPEDIF